MNATHSLFIRCPERQSFQWSDYEPSADEHATVAHNLVKLARFENQRVQQVKVPRFLLRFAFHSLSLDPLPPSIVTDCLSIIAIDLGCDVPAVMSGGRYVCVRRLDAALALDWHTSGTSLKPDISGSENNRRCRSSASTPIQVQDNQPSHTHFGRSEMGNPRCSIRSYKMPSSPARLLGTLPRNSLDVVHVVRTRGGGSSNRDEVFNSYLFLTWSEWSTLGVKVSTGYVP